jgi:hypothetical protein
MGTVIERPGWFFTRRFGEHFDSLHSVKLARRTVVRAGQAAICLSAFNPPGEPLLKPVGRHPHELAEPDYRQLAPPG